MRHDLKVPFAEKDQAKKLGARWDAARKRWYIDGGLDPADVREVAAGAARRVAPQCRPSVQARRAGWPRARCRWAAASWLPRVCDCLPWDDCDACRLQAWPK
jgi:hypothetical protein